MKMSTMKQTHNQQVECVSMLPNINSNTHTHKHAHMYNVSHCMVNNDSRSHQPEVLAAILSEVEGGITQRMELAWVLELAWELELAWTLANSVRSVTFYKFLLNRSVPINRVST